MKKILTLILSLLLTFAALAGCTPTTPPSEADPTKPADGFDVDKGLNISKIFYDDFSNGISSDKWNIGFGKWGTTFHGGVIPENIGYTADGQLVITGNGTNYVGDKKGTEGGNSRLTHGRASGGQLISRKPMTPGRFETRMKVMPRFGATSAFWTFFYENSEKANHEIDIELCINDDFRTSQFTNWTGVDAGYYDTRNFVMKDKNENKVANNDGDWHTYKFEWHTNPARVDYYVDDIHYYTSTANIPTYAGQINLGVWFAAFAGTADFETDHCYVDWIKVTPYDDQPCDMTASSGASPESYYPKAPMAKPALPNLVSNAKFDNPAIMTSPTAVPNYAWRFYGGTKDKTLSQCLENTNGRNGTSALTLGSHDEAYQFITSMVEGFEAKLSTYVKYDATTSGKIIIDYMPLDDSVLSSEVIDLNSSTAGFTANEFFLIEKTFKLPAGARRIRIRLVADEKTGNVVHFDDLFLNTTKLRNAYAV